jgi:hypothetical protein
MHPIITIFCAFTREWAVDPWLDCLSKVKHDPALTNLCFIIDCDNPYILAKLKNGLDHKGYRSMYTRMNDQHQVNEVRVAVRRQRIAEIKNQSKELILQTDGEFIISFEDDTVFDLMGSFEPLLHPMLVDPRCGFVEGVQCGRWGVKMIGAWNIYGNDEYGPTVAKTLLPDEGYAVISGGGWYGYATRRDLYVNCDYYSSSTQPWGPDVNYGLWLTSIGYSSLVNWDLVFGHRDFNKILYPDGSITEIVYNKDVKTGRWNRNENTVSN